MFRLWYGEREEPDILFVLNIRLRRHIEQCWGQEVDVYLNNFGVKRRTSVGYQ